jgi:cell wall-associated NlpC family hydrolase
VPKARWLVVGSLLVVTSLGVTHSVSASPIDDKRKEAARIADRIDALENEAFNLGEEYDRVQAELTRVDSEVAAAQKRVDTLESQISSMRTAVQGFAVQSYIYGVQGDGIATLLGAGDAPAVAAQREQYTELVLGSSVHQIDKLESVTQDASQERKLLEEKQTTKRTLQAALASKQKQVDAAIKKANSMQAAVKGQLATLVVQAQSRKAAAAAARLRSRSSASNATPTQTSTGGSSGRSAGRSAGGSSGPRAGSNVPAPRPGAAGAVAAAMSQLGVGYRYATAIPGVAFDCSGLTAWAWGQAGVSLPHQSRAQFSVVPHVSRDQIQPGDLVFYYNPIGHVAIYIGNGQIVHATRPGDVVKVAAVNWGKVVGIGRP